MVHPIIRKQIFYQTSHKEIWMRNPRSPLYIIPYWIAFWGGMGYSTYYLGRLILGKKADA